MSAYTLMQELNLVMGDAALCGMPKMLSNFSTGVHCAQFGRDSLAFVTEAKAAEKSRLEYNRCRHQRSLLVSTGVRFDRWFRRSRGRSRLDLLNSANFATSKPGLRRTKLHFKIV